MPPATIYCYMYCDSVHCEYIMSVCKIMTTDVELFLLSFVIRSLVEGQVRGFWFMKSMPWFLSRILFFVKLVIISVTNFGFFLKYYFMYPRFFLKSFFFIYEKQILHIDIRNNVLKQYENIHKNRKWINNHRITNNGSKYKNR